MSSVSPRNWITNYDGNLHIYLYLYFLVCVDSNRLAILHWFSPFLFSHPLHRFDYFVFRNHMCIIFELLHINLYELIKKNKFQGFSLQLVRKFAHSLLQCLDALNRFKIIHCDLKPENILLKQQGRSGIKVSWMCCVHVEPKISQNLI